MKASLEAIAILFFSSRSVRTKTVLSKSLPLKRLPLLSKPSGYGMVTTATGFYVFVPSAP